MGGSVGMDTPAPERAKTLVRLTLDTLRQEGIRLVFRIMVIAGNNLYRVVRYRVHKPVFFSYPP
jgi:hypothetical protein